MMFKVVCLALMALAQSDEHIQSPFLPSDSSKYTQLEDIDYLVQDFQPLDLTPPPAMKAVIPVVIQEDDHTIPISDIILTTDPSSPNLMQIPKCNNLAKRLLTETLTRCNISLIISNYPQWISDYTTNVCSNPECFNVFPEDVVEIRRTCPENYVGRIKIEEGGRVFYLKARVSDWTNVISPSVVKRIPACTSDITGEIISELVGSTIPQKNVVCSRCAKLMSQSMLEASTLPLFSGLTLSNKNTYKVNDVTIWESMGDTCGEEFMHGLSQSVAVWDYFPRAYLMIAVFAVLYWYRYGYSLKLNI